MTLMTAVARRARRPIRIRPVAVLLGAILIAAVTQVSAILVHPTRPPTAATNAASTGGELAADPADPGHVAGGVGVTGAQFDWLANGISVWTRKLSENSQDYISATNLGSLYLQRARLTANIDDYDRAARSIAQALVADPGYESGRTVELNVLFATHQFATALEHAQSLLADDSGNLQARAIRGTSQPWDSRHWRNVSLVSSVTARVLAYQGKPPGRWRAPVRSHSLPRVLPGHAPTCTGL